MAFPFLAVASLVLGGLGTALSAYGSYRQARAAQKQARYQADVARNNRIIAEQEADAAIERGEAEARTHRRKIANLEGQQAAAMAAGNIDISSGSALDVFEDTALLGELDIQTIKNNARLEARRAEIEGINYDAQAGLYDTAADDFNPVLTGGTTLLSGASSVASKWYQWNRASEVISPTG